MAYNDAENHWADDDRYYSSGRSSDDSPILYRKKRIGTSTRRSALTILAKFFLFSSAMIIFCVLMYIPVYRRVRYHSRAVVEGWSMDANRDTKIYINPNNITTLYNPKTVCPKHGKKLFLLIIVTSAASHTNIRNSIRKTYANYDKYLKLSKLFHEVTEENKNCLVYDKDLESFVIGDNCTNSFTTAQTVIKGFRDLLPELEKSLREKLKNYKPIEVHKQTTKAEFDPFDMNKDLIEDTTFNYNDYDYDKNVMKIPADGENEQEDKMDKILSVLSQVYKENAIVDSKKVDNPDFKVLFLVGKPTHNNSKVVDRIQKNIDAEIKVFSDVIQEDFIDTYNNLTLKSIMMLKWVTNNCQNSVRYVLKADDDVYVHVPHLMDVLREKAQQFDKKLQVEPSAKEYLLMGKLVTKARPVQNIRNKWYSPKYMYPDRFYPDYLSGVGYVMSYNAADALYKAALETSLFHLEDIFITGICSVRATPPLRPLSHPSLSYSPATPCAAHSTVTTVLYNTSMEAVSRALADPRTVTSCERLRLIRVRKKLEKAKLKMKEQKKRHPLLVHR